MNIDAVSWSRALLLALSLFAGVGTAAAQEKQQSAYQKHIKSAHFLKYKSGTQHMVKSLELIDTIPLVPDMKIK